MEFSMGYDLGNNTSLDNTTEDSPFQDIPEVSDELSEQSSVIPATDIPVSEQENISDLPGENSGNFVDIPEVPDTDFDDPRLTEGIADQPEPNPPADDPLPPADDADPITVHPGRGPEFEPTPETEPISVPPEGGTSNPPEGWRPGGPEGGG
jgi:hypothetical protein